MRCKGSMDNGGKTNEKDLGELHFRGNEWLIGDDNDKWLKGGNTVAESLGWHYGELWITWILI